MSESSISATAEVAAAGRMPLTIPSANGPAGSTTFGRETLRRGRCATLQLWETLRQINVVAVVPAYNEAAKIESTLGAIPDFVRTIVVVDDASTDATAEIVARCAARDDRIVCLRHQANQGLGSVMVRGYRAALERDADVVVKIDGDGQMSPDDLPDLLAPLVLGRADYSKGNRFHDFAALRQMPLIRRLGNVALSFLTKAAVGYWNLFDPCNGYVAIRGDVLRKMDLKAIPGSFFFETSMLANLNLLGAVVKDVALPARYGDEDSHLSIGKVLWEFPRRLLGCFLRRMWLKNFLYDFSMESVYLLSGVPLLFSGLLYGGANWYWYWCAGQGAPTGTVVIPAMMIILGFQLLLAAINEDVRNTPQEPLGGVLLELGTTAFSRQSASAARAPSTAASWGGRSAQ